MNRLRQLQDILTKLTKVFVLAKSKSNWNLIGAWKDFFFSVCFFEDLYIIFILPCSCGLPSEPFPRLEGYLVCIEMPRFHSIAASSAGNGVSNSLGYFS